MRFEEAMEHYDNPHGYPPCGFCHRALGEFLTEFSDPICAGCAEEREAERGIEPDDYRRL